MSEPARSDEQPARRVRQIDERDRRKRKIVAISLTLFILLTCLVATEVLFGGG